MQCSIFWKILLSPHFFTQCGRSKLVFTFNFMLVVEFIVLCLPDSEIAPEHINRKYKASNRRILIPVVFKLTSSQYTVSCGVWSTIIILWCPLMCSTTQLPRLHSDFTRLYKILQAFSIDSIHYFWKDTTKRLFILSPCSFHRSNKEDWF